MAWWCHVVNYPHGPSCSLTGGASLKPACCTVVPIMPSSKEVGCIPLCNPCQSGCQSGINQQKAWDPAIHSQPSAFHQNLTLPASQFPNFYAALLSSSSSLLVLKATSHLISKEHIHKICRGVKIHRCVFVGIFVEATKWQNQSQKANATATGSLSVFFGIAPNCTLDL